MAQKIPEEIIAEIISKASIEDIIGERVKLEKKGKNLFGYCPFHEERTPSFSVNPEKQIFHCFSCGRGGNVFSFLMQLDGLTFPESIYKVSDKINFPISEKYRTSEKKVYVSNTDKNILKTNKSVAELFSFFLLKGKQNNKPLDYLLEKRKLSLETIKKFGIGYAKSDNFLVNDVINGNNEELKKYQNSGLISKKEDYYFDWFRNRIIFPVKNISGEIVGFSGRSILKDEKVKYLNSPETSVFNKSKLLFNIDNALPEIRKEKKVFLFEGFMDVISATNAGVVNSVSSMGTSLTKENILTLNKYSNEVIVVFDGDDAGQESTWRAYKEIKKIAQLDVYSVRIPDKMDPDEFIQKFGNDEFLNLLKNNKENIIQFSNYFLRKNKNMSNPNDIELFLNEMIDVILLESDDIQTEFIFNSLNKEFKIDKEILKKKLENVRIKNKTKTKIIDKKNINNVKIVKKDLSNINNIEKAEITIFISMLYDNQVWRKIVSNKKFKFIDLKFQILFSIASEFKKNNANNKFKPYDFIDYIKDQEIEKFYVYIEEISDRYPTIFKKNENEINSEIDFLIEKNDENVFFIDNDLSLKNDEEKKKELNKKIDKLRKDFQNKKK